MFPDGTLAVLFLLFGLSDMGLNYCGEPGGCLARDDAAARITVSAGDVYYQTNKISEEVYLRYDLDHTLGPFQPHFGLSVTGEGSTFVSFGSSWTKDWNGFYFSLAAAPGLYFPGGGQTIGSRLEFRSELEIGYEWKNGVRLGMMTDHRSNAGIDGFNPGLETIQLRVSVPVGTVKR